MKNCEITLKLVITAEKKEYVVKETDILEGYWCPHQYHTFFNNSVDFSRWKRYLVENAKDKTLEYSTFDRYCDLNNIDYNAFPFEEYVTEEDVKNRMSSYNYVWNSEDDSITPTSAMINLEHYGTKRLGIVCGKYILVWSDLNKCNNKIPVQVLGDIAGIETQK